MKKSRSFLSATALGSFTAAAALLVGLSGAQAQAPSPGPALSGAGSFPGSFIVPGTNTSLHIGGVISLDMQYDTTEFDGGVSPGAHDNEYPAATGVQGAGAAFSSTGNNSHGVFRMTDLTGTPSSARDLRPSLTLSPRARRGPSEPRTMGITLGYSHAWTDEWRSGISAGIDEVSKPSAAGLWLQPGGIRNAAGGFVGAAAGAAASGQTLGTNSGQTSALALIEKRHLSANASIMWSPLPAVQFGAEFQWYHRVVQSGASGSHERIETQALFKF